MRKIKCLVVDDEPLAIEVLRSYIKSLDNYEITGTCSNAIEAINFLQRNTVDLMFLDIQMPRLTGIDFLKTLAFPPKVILTTAYKEYALDGFELNVLDYLLKPISFERFLVAINKFREGSNQKQSSSVSDPNINEEPFLYVKADKKMQKIFLKDIIYLESLKDYVKVKTVDRILVTHQTMNYFEEKLPDNKFIRVHRSFIVAKKRINSITGTYIEVEAEKIPIGRFYKIEVMKLLQV